MINLLVGLRFPDQGRVQLLGGDPEERRKPPAARDDPAGCRPRFGCPRPCTLPRGTFPTRYRPARFWSASDSAGRRAARSADCRVAREGSWRSRWRSSAGRGSSFWDEPTTGLDVEARRTVWDAIGEFHRTGGAVLLSSHHLEEVEQLAHRVVVMGHGRVLADAKPPASGD